MSHGAGAPADAWVARVIGLLPRTIPLENPQSNGMAEAFVRTIKGGYVRVFT